MNPRHAKLLCDMERRERYQDSLYDDYPYGYHQDYVQDITPSWCKAILSFGTPLLLLGGAALYTLFYALDYNLLSFQELAWNILVHLTPYKLLTILDKEAQAASLGRSKFNKASRHAEKNAIMRRLVGLDKGGGLMGAVAQGSRRLSVLSGINLPLIGGGEEDDGPPGLGNWDNSCYQNSVLQGLASLEGLGDYLAGPQRLGTTKSNSKENGESWRGEELLDDQGPGELEMASSLRTLISKLNDPANNGRKLWTPAALKSMSSWQQQDAQEYFSKVLEEIDSEISKTASKTLSPSQGLTLDAKPSRQTLLDTLPTTELRNPLEGLLAQRVGCTSCGYSEGFSLIPFNCLTVPLGRFSPAPLSECLDEYTKLEPISGVQCAKCTLLRYQKLLSVLVSRNASQPKIEGEDDKMKEVDAMKERLSLVAEALEDELFEDKVLKRLKIPPKNRAETTKSRQAVVARPPKSLVVHVNRSMFEENTGELRKNYANVKFDKTLDLGPWCLGSNGRASVSKDGEGEDKERWLTDPQKSMIASSTSKSMIKGPIYELKAIVTHYGRHENGHYIAYRRRPAQPASESDTAPGDFEGVSEKVADEIKPENKWYRLSDDEVSCVSEGDVLAQGGVFMLFYDMVEPARRVPPTIPNAGLWPTKQAELAGLKERSGNIRNPAPMEGGAGMGSIERKKMAAASLPTREATPELTLPLSEPFDPAYTIATDKEVGVIEPSAKLVLAVGGEVEDTSDEDASTTSSLENNPVMVSEPVKPIVIKPFTGSSGRNRSPTSTVRERRESAGIIMI